jgi:uncharacterized protein (DUF427 family)
MARALWNGEVIAESDSFKVVEDNIYFPVSAIRREFFKASPTTYECCWKGTAHYYTLLVKGAENADAAWYYPNPNPKAAEIKDHIAFWHDVTVER